MAAEHTSVLKMTDIKTTSLGWRIFPNVVGSGWVGNLVTQYASSKGGLCVELMNAHFQPFGLLVKSSEGGRKVFGGGFDRVGWQTIRITEADVGRRIAVFTVIDAKTEGYSSMSKDQRNFAREVLKAGGEAYISRRDGDGVRLEPVGVENHPRGKK